MYYALYSSEDYDATIDAILLACLWAVGMSERPGVEMPKSAAGVAHVCQRVRAERIVV